MKKLAVGVCAVVAAAVSAVAGTTFVEDFAALQTALGGAQDGDELRLKAGEWSATATLATDRAVTLSGGWTDADTRSAGAKTTLDAAGGAEADVPNILSFTATSGQIVLDRLVLTHSYRSALRKSGAASLAMTDCELRDNGFYATTEATGCQGLGAYLSGVAGSSTLALTNCVVSGNYKRRSTSGAPYSDLQGQGLFVQSFRRATLVGCEVVRNGYDYSDGIGSAIMGRESADGAALYFHGTPVTAIGCRIVGNTSCVHTQVGSVVWVGGSSGGHAFTNCLFASNYSSCWNSSSANGDRNQVGALFFEIGAANSAALDHCTFAYNVMDGARGAAGLAVESGKVSVRNSIFISNVADTDKGMAADMATCSANAQIDVAWSGLRSVASPYVRSDKGGVLAVDEETLTLGDLRLATDEATFLANVSGAKDTLVTVPSAQYPIGPKDWTLTFDAHLMSSAGRYDPAAGAFVTTDKVASPAIDAGDPSAPYALEPEPNGARANLGCYGNTAEASKTVPPGQPSVENLTVSFGYEYTQPRFTFGLGGDGDFKARVYLCSGLSAGTGIKGWDNVRLVTSSAGLGESFDLGSGGYYPSGATVYWSVVVVPEQGATVKAGGSATATGETPPFLGKTVGSPNVVYVREGAKGLCTGANWTDAVPTLEAAYALLTAERNEIWLGGATLSGSASVMSVLNRALAIRGGFTGFEEAPDMRPAGARTVIDGHNAANCLSISHSTAVEVERVELVRGLEHGLVNQNGTLTLTDCRIASNGGTVTASDGRGANLSGGTVTFVNCAIEGNQTPETWSGTAAGANGCGISASGLTRLTLEGCSFLTNGLPAQVHPGPGGYPGYRDGMCGVAVYANNTPVTVLNCRFVGNRSAVHMVGSGGTVKLVGTTKASAFTNCLWTANSAMPGWPGASPSIGGQLYVSLGSAQATVDLVNCTMAYNLIDASTCSSGLTVDCGRVKVRNSIIVDNVIRANCTATEAVSVRGASSAVDIDYSLVGGEGTPYMASVDGGTLVQGENMVYGAADLMTTPAEFLAQVRSTTGAEPALPATSGLFYFAEEFEPLAAQAFNVHLRGKAGYADETTGELVTSATTSLGVDAGDPFAPYGLEPDPNGECVNLGFYGNTPWATRSSAGGTPDVSAAEIDFDYEYTQPHFAFTMGGEGDFKAAVYLCTGLAASGEEGTNGWASVRRVGTAVTPGAALDFGSGEYFRPGETLHWRVVVMPDRGEAVTKDGTATVTGVLPPFYGKTTGLPNVVYVRDGAKGLCTGANWTDAVPTLEAAYALLTAERNEIWLGGATLSGSADSAVPSPVNLAFTVRGGFTGFEETAAARPAGAHTVLDGHDRADGLAIEHSTSAVAIERIDFVRGKVRGLTNVDGVLTVTDCRFAANGGTTTQVSGRGASAMKKVGAGNSSSVTFVDCAFVGNVTPAIWSEPPQGADGCGIYAEGLARLTLEGCLFLTNGLPAGLHPTVPGGYPAYRDGLRGAAVCAVSTPVTAIGCRFIGNRGTMHSSITGGTVHLAGHGAGTTSAFTNCLWAANEGVRAYSSISTTATTGGQVYAGGSGSLEIEGCTMAYNLVDGSACAAGLTVEGPAVRVRNSIIAANLIVEGSDGAADLFVRSGSADVDYTMLGGSDTNYVQTSGGSLTLGENVLYGDPRFMTTTDEFLAAVSNLSDKAAALPRTAGRIFFADDFDPAGARAFNLHLRGATGYADETTGARVCRGPTSPAVDAGDPASPYGNEPRPNGDRVNLGFYGNTPWATCSKGGLLLIVR